MSDPRLGRIFQPDHRDQAYLLRHSPLLAVADPGTISTGKVPVGTKLWDAPVLYDQGQTPACTAYAASTCMSIMLAVRHPGAQDTLDAGQLYQWANSHDGIAQPHDGSTVRAAMQGLQTVGDQVMVEQGDPLDPIGSDAKIKNYLWADTTQPLADVPTIVSWLLNVGPVEIGTNWYNNMFEPGPTGWVNIGGPIEGGHAYTLRGVNTTGAKTWCNPGGSSYVVMRNSWGPWGVTVVPNPKTKVWDFQRAQGGDAIISLAHLEALLGQDGEAGAIVLPSMV